MESLAQRSKYKKIYFVLNFDTRHCFRYTTYISRNKLRNAKYTRNFPNKVLVYMFMSRCFTSLWVRWQNPWICSAPFRLNFQFDNLQLSPHTDSPQIGISMVWGSPHTMYSPTRAQPKRVFIPSAVMLWRALYVQSPYRRSKNARVVDIRPGAMRKGSG